MGGVAPKPQALRQRRNKKSTAATLGEHDLEVPPLPIERSWHEQTIAEWMAIWESPMASEFHQDGDVSYYGLMKYAILLDDFHNAESANQRKDLMVEIRLQRQSFGLTPRDRAGLHWELDRGSQAEERRTKRAERQSATPPAEGEQDPRAALGKQGLQVLQGGASA